MMLRLLATVAFILSTVPAFAFWPFSKKPSGVYSSTIVQHAGYRVERTTTFDFRTDGTVVYRYLFEISGGSGEPGRTGDTAQYRWKAEGGKVLCLAGEQTVWTLKWDEEDLVLNDGTRFKRER